MNILLLTSHAIAEHDDLEMFTRMGIPCYSIGGAYDEIPFEGKRPAVPNMWFDPWLEAATNEQRVRLSADLGDPGSNIDWAKARLAPEVIDWADTIIVHHFPEQWIGGQWSAIRDKRVIWRTCGQSDPRLEAAMSRYRLQGLEIVRYSPKERVAFTASGSFAGEDAMIRFGKDPDEWSGWTGDGRVTGSLIGRPLHEQDAEPFIGNITQHMAQRGDACGYEFYMEATEGLPARPAGPGSEALPGGMGGLTYEGMKAYLRSARVYLYTGTRPASYTLGLIEAAMTGTPVVYMGPEPFGCGDLYDFWGTEGPFNIAKGPHIGPESHLSSAHEALQRYLEMPRAESEAASRLTRQRAVALYGLDTIMAQWHRFLGTAS